MNAYWTPGRCTVNMFIAPYYSHTIEIEGYRDVGLKQYFGVWQQSQLPILSPYNLVPLNTIVDIRDAKGSRKKSVFFLGDPATKALPPPPLNLVAIDSFFSLKIAETDFDNNNKKSNIFWTKRAIFRPGPFLRLP